MKDFLLGWHERMYPLGLPYRLRGGWERSVAREKLADKPFRDFESVNFDKPAERAVAPTVAPSVRPVAEPTFAAGDRVTLRDSRTQSLGTVVPKRLDYANRDDVVAVRWDCGNSEYLYYTSQVIPAQREQVASPSVRQPDSKGEGTTASDGEWVEWDFRQGLPDLPLSTFIEVTTTGRDNLGKRQLMHQITGPLAGCIAYRVVK